MVRVALVDDFDPLKGKMLQILDKGGKVVAPKLEPKLPAELLKKLFLQEDEVNNIAMNGSTSFSIRYRRNAFLSYK